MFSGFFTFMDTGKGEIHTYLTQSTFLCVAAGYGGACLFFQIGSFLEPAEVWSSG